MWKVIQALVRGGATVLLMTQYMEEADRLANGIVVIDKGRKIAHGTSDELKTQLGGERVEIVLASPADAPAACATLGDLSVGEVQVDEQTRRLTAAVTGGADVLRQALQRLADRDITVNDVGLRRPTLDDVFLTLTGHSAEEKGEPTEDDKDDPAQKPGENKVKEAVR